MIAEETSCWTDGQKNEDGVVFMSSKNGVMWVFLGPSRKGAQK
jgi:hypothetical protein